MFDALPKAKSLSGDRGYDSDWFRKALIEKGIEPCIPPKKNRKIQHDYDHALYKKRHKRSSAGDGACFMLPIAKAIPEAVRRLQFWAAWPTPQGQAPHLKT